MPDGAWGLIGVLIGGLIAYFGTRKKNTADAAAAITNAATGLVSKLEDRVAKLETKEGEQDCKITRFGQRVIYLMDGIKKLTEQIIGLGHIPAWKPDEWDPDKET